MQVIVGAGPIGSAVARLVADAGEPVRVVTRSGGGPEHPMVERIAADASDPRALAAATAGATVLYNCANPGDYTQWEQNWPPLAASLLHAAAHTDAVLVTTGNLYGYGPVDGPMTQQTPLRPSDHKGELRAKMWDDMRAAQRDGRLRGAVEVRGSDYIGPTLPTGNGLIAMYANSTLAGKTAWTFGDPDQPHSWTAVGDMARTLVAAGADDRAWGRAWLVPSHTASAREVLRALGERAGTGEPRLRRVPAWVLRAGGMVVPLLREVTGVLYQFERPFVVDATATTELLGIDATAWSQTLDETAAAWHARSTRG